MLDTVRFNKWNRIVEHISISQGRKGALDLRVIVDAQIREQSWGKMVYIIYIYNQSTKRFAQALRRLCADFAGLVCFDKTERGHRIVFCTDMNTRIKPA